MRFKTAPVTQDCILSFWSLLHFQKATKLVHAKTSATTKNTNHDRFRDKTLTIRKIVHINAQAYVPSQKTFLSKGSNWDSSWRDSKTHSLISPPSSASFMMFHHLKPTSNRPVTFFYRPKVEGEEEDAEDVGQNRVTPQHPAEQIDRQAKSLKE